MILEGLVGSRCLLFFQKIHDLFQAGYFEFAGFVFNDKEHTGCAIEGYNVGEVAARFEWLFVHCRREFGLLGLLGENDSWLLAGRHDLTIFFAGERVDNEQGRLFLYF